MDISEFITINYVDITRDTIILSKNTKEWCKRPYNNKNGCPNINNDKCKNAPYFNDIIDNTYKYFLIIYAEFDLEQYIKIRMKENSQISNAQAKCVLYWQNSVKMRLKQAISHILYYNYAFNSFPFKIFSCGSGFNILGGSHIYSMEACGINVFSTMRLNGVKMEIKPEHKVRLVCLICAQTPIKKCIFDEALF